MRTVLKYVLTDDEVQRVKMPMFAKIVAVQSQHNRVTLWALIDSQCGAWTGKMYGERCNLNHDHDEPHSFDPKREETPIKNLPAEERIFRLAMTGQPHSSSDLTDYLGTVQLNREGMFVVHVFEEEDR